MFTLDHDPVDGSHLIVAGGELDLAATSEMSAIFAMAAAGPQDAVVLDLVAVDFIDSSALGTILRAAQSLEASGKRLHVVTPEGPVRRLLEITGTASRFSLHATRDDAFAAPRSARGSARRGPPGGRRRAPAPPRTAGSAGWGWRSPSGRRRGRSAGRRRSPRSRPRCSRRGAAAPPGRRPARACRAPPPRRRPSP